MVAFKAYSTAHRMQSRHCFVLRQMVQSRLELHTSPYDAFEMYHAICKQQPWLCAGAPCVSWIDRPRP
jgi:hypothetical protein